MSLDGLVTFYASLQAMRAEKVLTRAGHVCRLIPGPRDVSPHCGVALQFRLADAVAVEGALAGARVQIEGLHAYALDDVVDALAHGDRRGRWA
jgi:hypothetical protein